MTTGIKEDLLTGVNMIPTKIEIINKGMRWIKDLTVNRIREEAKAEVLNPIGNWLGLNI